MRIAAEGRVVDVVKFADAVFGQRAVLLARFVGVAEQPNKKLINPQRYGALPDFDRRRILCLQIDFEVVRNVFVPCAFPDRRIARTEKTAPRLVLGEVLRVKDDLQILA